MKIFRIKSKLNILAFMYYTRQGKILLDHVSTQRLIIACHEKN